MMRYLSVAALVAVAATAAYAQGLTGTAAIKERKALMKSQGQEMYRVARPMSKGETPYDQAAATKVFSSVIESSEKLKALWGTYRENPVF